MTQLSLKAQAVLDAAHFVYWTYDEVHVADPAVIAAAALRVAADQCAEGATHWELYVIADELEGANA